MNGKNIRYGSRRTADKKKAPMSFAGKVVCQTVACVGLFLVCLPISATDIGLKEYISVSLVSTGDIDKAVKHFKEMCIAVNDRFPILEDNAMWSGFMELMRKPTDDADDVSTAEQDTEQLQQVPPQSAGNPLDLIAQAASEGFVYPENVNMIMPIDGLVTSPFGLREHPVSGEDASHYGVDIAADMGDAILTTAAGKVIEVKTHDIYGNCVLIQHTERIKSFYAHMDAIYVSEGDILGDGATIGTVGATGVTTGPHLHFGVRVDDEPTDPERYIMMKHK